MTTLVAICTAIAAIISLWNKMYPSPNVQAIEAADKQKEQDDKIIDADIGPVKPV